MFTNISPRSQLAGLSPLCPQGPAWGRCSSSAVGGSEGAATRRNCPAGGRIRTPIQDSFCCTLSFFLVWFVLSLPFYPAPPRAPPTCTSCAFHQVRGTNCDNCFIVSTTFRLEGCSSASPHASHLHHTGPSAVYTRLFSAACGVFVDMLTPQVTGGAHHKMPRGWGSPGSGARGEASVLTDLLSDS